jgi:hypothetical protein
MKNMNPDMPLDRFNGPLISRQLHAMAAFKRNQPLRTIALSDKISIAPRPAPATSRLMGR